MKIEQRLREQLKDKQLTIIKMDNELVEVQDSRGKFIGVTIILTSLLFFSILLLGIAINEINYKTEALHISCEELFGESYKYTSFDKETKNIVCKIEGVYEQRKGSFVVEAGV